MLIYYSFVCFVKDDIHARDFCGLVYFLYCTSLTGFSLLSVNVQLCSQSVDSLVSFVQSLCVCIVCLLLKIFTYSNYCQTRSMRLHTCT